MSPVKLRHCVPAVLVCVSGCAAPDVSTEISGLTTAVSAAETHLGAQLDSEIESQRIAARNARIEEGLSVYGSADGCELATVASLEARASDCHLEPLFAAPDGPGTPQYSRVAFSVVQAYAETVAAIAASDAPGEIRTNTGRFLSAFNGFYAAARDQEGAVAIPQGRIDPISRIAGRLSEAARAHALRRLVNGSHEPLEFVLREIIAEREVEDGLVDAANAVDLAYGAMARAETGPTAQYRLAVEAYETAVGNLQRLATTSQYARLRLIWLRHNQLRNGLQVTPNLEEIVEIAEEIHALTSN